MKRKTSNLIIVAIFLGLFPLTLHAVPKERIRTQDLAEVKQGKITQPTVLSDEDGEVYLEFLNNTLVLKNNGKLSFEGQILAPTIIPLPARPPRSRMQEIVSFELLGSTNEKLFFGDKFDRLSEKNKYRLQYYDPDEFQRTAQVRVLIPVNEKINYATLYEYDEDRKEWKVMGGKIGASENAGEKIFVGQIKSTGIFTLFNDDPDPSFVAPFPLDQIKVVEEGPGDFKNGACFMCNNREINEAGFTYEEGVYDPFQKEYTGDSLSGGSGNVFSGEIVPAVINPTDTTASNMEEMGTKINEEKRNISIYATDIICEEGTIFSPGEYDPYEQTYTGDELKMINGRPAFLDPKNPNPLTKEQIESLPPTCRIVMQDRTTPKKEEPPKGPLSKTGKEDISPLPIYIVIFLGMMGGAIFLGLKKKKDY